MVARHWQGRRQRERLKQQEVHLRRFCGGSKPRVCAAIRMFTGQARFVVMCCPSWTVLDHLEPQQMR